MKHQKQLLAVLLMGAACTLQAQRSETLLEKNWKFSKGDFKEASQPEFNDTNGNRLLFRTTGRFSVHSI